MSVHPALLHGAPDGAARTGIALVDSADGLRALHAPGCAAAVWARRAPDGFEDWIDALAPDRLPQARGKVSAARVSEAVASVCDQAGTPPGPHRDWLIEDAGRLADAFSALAGTTRLRLRFDVVTGDACRRWHIDNVTARLICTYRGAGTQLGVSSDFEARADPAAVFAAPPAAPLVLRGTLWPESPPAGLLHRSPPIEGTGETRLLLVFDPLKSTEG